MNSSVSRRLVVAAAALGLAVGFAAPVAAQETVALTVSLKGNKFEPAEIKAPAGKPITLTVKNLDPTPAEFESKHLKLEKVVKGGGEIVFNIRALVPGKYKFFDEYHEATAQGVLVVE